ncbi:MAG: hypothetical protein K0U47_05550 [Epsilonproteobacteria bacterium]|nr:hypothetical protein [Campylobacterota bacterium]
MEKKPIEVTGATEPFLTYEEDGITYYEFDSSLCTPPAPMVNAMSGLKLIDTPDKRLIMINMKQPMGLFPKIEKDFSWRVEELEDEKVKLTFSRKSEGDTQTDFDNNQCNG